MYQLYLMFSMYEAHMFYGQRELNEFRNKMWQQWNLVEYDLVNKSRAFDKNQC